MIDTNISILETSPKIEIKDEDESRTHAVTINGPNCGNVDYTKTMRHFSKQVMGRTSFYTKLTNQVRGSAYSVRL
jgi:hypothetical protein